MASFTLTFACSHDKPQCPTAGCTTAVNEVGKSTALHKMGTHSF